MIIHTPNSAASGEVPEGVLYWGKGPQKDRCRDFPFPRGRNKRYLTHRRGVGVRDPQSSQVNAETCGGDGLACEGHYLISARWCARNDWVVSADTQFLLPGSIPASRHVARPHWGLQQRPPLSGPGPLELGVPTRPPTCTHVLTARKNDRKPGHRNSTCPLVRPDKN